MRKRLALALVLAAWPLAGLAQDRVETLADIRGQLNTVGNELSALRSELVSTGAVARVGGADMLQRMEMVELELMRLTGKSEELELRINRVVADGSNRLGDLEFRITELEGGDVSSLPNRPPLGSDKPAAPMTPAVPPVANSTKPAAPGDKADFDRAREVLGQGDFRTAEGLFAAHAAAWPDSALNGEVLYLRGEALDGLGETAQAARSYLDSFSRYPDGGRAADALFGLGRALGRLGQIHEACLTLGEVPARYPGHSAAAQSDAERVALACP